MLEWAVGGALWTVTCLGPLYAGWRLAGRWVEAEARAARGCAAGVAGAAFAVALFEVSLRAGLFDRFALAAIGLVLAGGARLVTVPAGSAPAARGWREWLPLAPLALGLAIVTGRALALPPLSWDDLSYHLYFAGTWASEGEVFPFAGPYGRYDYSYFPHNGEALTAWFMLPFQADLPVALLGAGFVTLGALALYALARELGLGRGDAAWLPGLVGLAPMVLGYVGTASVDLQVFAETAAAALFLARYRRTRRGGDAIACCAAIGLAVGTKHVALASGGLIGLTLACAVAAGCVRRRSARPLLALAGGVALAAALGTPQYLANIVETGNPLHPLPLVLGGETLFPAGESVLRGFETRGLGDPFLDFENLRRTLGYEPVEGPRTAGPKFALFALVAVLSLVSPMRAGRRADLRLLALFGLVPVLMFYLDGSANTVMARRFWPVDSARFLAGPLALVSAVAVAELLSLTHGRAVIRGAFAVAMLVDLVHGLRPLPDPLVNGALVAAFLGVLAAIGAACRWRSPVVGALAAALGLAWVSVLGNHRDATRYPYLASLPGLHATPRDLVAGWAWLDRPGSPRTIALTTGWAGDGHNWFFYPLMGRRLQNRVVYVSTTRRGIDLSPTVRPVHPPAPRRDTWLENLGSAGVGFVFVQRPWPPELEWMQGDPSRFEVAAGGDSFRIFAVRGN